MAGRPCCDTRRGCCAAVDPDADAAAAAAAEDEGELPLALPMASRVGVRGSDAATSIPPPPLACDGVLR